MSTKIDFGYESWLRIWKVLAPYNIRPKTIPLIKIQMDVVSFKCLLSQNNKKRKFKRKKKYFFGLDKD